MFLMRHTRASFVRKLFSRLRSSIRRWFMPSSGFLVVMPACVTEVTDYLKVDLVLNCLPPIIFDYGLRFIRSVSRLWLMVFRIGRISLV